MNCPKCGKEMEKGTLTAGGRLVQWRPDEGSSGSVTICKFSLSFSPKGTPAYICRICRKVIADY